MRAHASTVAGREPGIYGYELADWMLANQEWHRKEMAPAEFVVWLAGELTQIPGDDPPMIAAALRATYDDAVIARIFVSVGKYNERNAAFVAERLRYRLVYEDPEFYRGIAAVRILRESGRIPGDLADELDTEIAARLEKRIIKNFDELAAHGLFEVIQPEIEGSDEDLTMIRRNRGIDLELLKRLREVVKTLKARSPVVSVEAVSNALADKAGRGRQER